MPIKVIQWGAGVNGSALIRAIHAHPDLELVGCRVYSDQKSGADAGVLAGIGEIGVRATNQRQAILELAADVVIHCPRQRPDLSENDQDVVDLLASGKHVISVTGTYSYPAAHPGYAERFEEACRKGGTVFAHTGINPGFICERLAPTLTGLCVDVDAVSVEESYLCDTGTADILFDAMRFGDAPEEWTADSPVGRLFNFQFVQMVHHMAHALGVELADVRHEASVVPAHRDIAVAGRVVRQGQVAAIVQSWEGVPREAGQIRVRKNTIWVIAPDIPGYPPKQGWQVRIDGKPSLELQLRYVPEGDRTYIPESMVGAAIPMIAEVMAAEPGILLPRIFAPFRKRIADPR